MRWLLAGLTLIAVLCWLPTGACAQDTRVDRSVAAGNSLPLVAAANDVSCNWLREHFPEIRIEVLFVDEDESPFSLDFRALGLRQAILFFYCSEDEPAVAALYRERLQTQGVRAVDLAAYLRPSKLGHNPRPNRPGSQTKPLPGETLAKWLTHESTNLPSNHE